MFEQLNSESLCCSDASHQVSAQSNFRFWRRCRLKNFKMTAMAVILDIGMEQFKQFWISKSLQCLSSFLLNLTYGLGGDVVWRISRWPPWWPSWIWNGTVLTILNLYNAPMPLIKFRLNLTYGLERDVIWRISRWHPWQPSWILEWNDFSNSEHLGAQNSCQEFEPIKTGD